MQDNLIDQDFYNEEHQSLERVTVKTFDTSVNAHLFRIELENEGIDSYIYDEETITMDPLLSNAIGGIKVKIDVKDIERTKEFLMKREEERNPPCPNCGSKKIMTNFRSFKSASGVMSAIASFLFTIYPPMFKTVNKCMECNNEFEDLDF
jgi:DNA-directed RNA polymerase subunit RPC12/RpoP